MLDALSAYTERHLARMDRLRRSVSLLDYTLGCMHVIEETALEVRSCPAEGGIGLQGLVSWGESGMQFLTLQLCALFAMGYGLASAVGIHPANAEPQHSQAAQLAVSDACLLLRPRHVIR